MFNDLEELIGYRFKNHSLLEEALIHSSYTKKNEKDKKNNKKIELLGDLVLGLIVNEYI